MNGFDSNLVDLDGLTASACAALLDPGGIGAKRYAYETPQRTLDVIAELRGSSEAISYLLSTYDIECDYCEDEQAQHVLREHSEPPSMSVVCDRCANELRKGHQGIGEGA